MKKKLIPYVLVLAILIIGLGYGIGTILEHKTLAYLTDYDGLNNRFTAGHNTSEITEEFPTPTPITPGDNTKIVKKVKIKNLEEKNNVPCYIRARVEFSTSEFGSYTLNGMSNKWVKGKDSSGNWDGYYYYKDLVAVGKETDFLFTSVDIDGTGVDKDTSAKEKELNIYVYEESCQARNPETLKNWNWMDAWKKALDITVQE